VVVAVPGDGSTVSGERDGRPSAGKNFYRVEEVAIDVARRVLGGIGNAASAAEYELQQRVAAIKIRRVTGTPEHVDQLLREIEENPGQVLGDAITADELGQRWRDRRPE
jgi:hypothetical protein